MKFLENLENVLLKDDRFVAEDGRVLKSKVHDAAMAMDDILLELLLSEPSFKEHFFKDVKGALVFDKVQFAWVLNSREFLPDSYTMYKNKIGLADNNGDVITQQNNVTLIWPYKDCVLEGGQTKEDEKRDEVFYNETLAPDQVTRLLYPKAFSNATRYTFDSQVDLTGQPTRVENANVSNEKITDFRDDDNLIIKGNNLLALSSLMRRYEGQVKLIYIDPPYNTPSAANTFDYNNSFNHSTWQTFMKNRIEEALKLLRKDGFFVISIDDNELFYLGVLCDELIGRDNRLAVISVVHNPGGRQDEEFFPTAHENMIVYAKDRSLAKLNNLPMSKEKASEYTMSDSIGSYKLRGYRRSGNNSLRTERPNMFYPIYFDKNNNSLSLIESNDSIEILPIDTRGNERCWRWDRKTFLEKKENYLVARETSSGLVDIYVKERSTDYKGEKAKTIWSKSEYTGQNATTTIKQIFDGEKAFTYPKSEFLMRDIIHIFSNPNDLVLDFFMGSGTTQAVAHKTQRQYIGIEQMNYINDVPVNRLIKVISGEQSGISKDVNWHGGGSFVYCELAGRSDVLISDLQSAADSDTVLAILDKVTDQGLLRPSVLPTDLNNTREEFLLLSLDKQKQLVTELLDKNKLYINLCDIDDENMGLSDDDKAFTRSFYLLDEEMEVLDD